jgi:hypothetical protein
MNAFNFHQPKQQATRRLPATVRMAVWPLAIDAKLFNITVPGIKGRAKM